MYFVVCVVGACEFLYEPLWLCCVCCNTDCEWRKLIHMYRGGWAWTSVWTALVVSVGLRQQTRQTSLEKKRVNSACVFAVHWQLLYYSSFISSALWSSSFHLFAYNFRSGPRTTRKSLYHIHAIHQSICMRVFSVVWCTINCVVHH
jgi:hypothetical protein